MTKEVICHAGKCEYTEDEYSFDEGCVDCNIVEQIEHDIILDQL